MLSAIKGKLQAVFRPERLSAALDYGSLAFTGLATIVLILSAVSAILTINFSLPLFDEWKLFDKWFESESLVEAATQRHNLYYLVILNIISYIEIRLFSYNGFLSVAVTWLALGAAAALMVRAFLSIEGWRGWASVRSAFLPLSILVVGLFFGAMNFKTTLWSLHIIVSLTFLFCILTLYGAAQEERLSWPQLLVTQFAMPVLAFLSNPNGGIVAMVVLVYWLLMRRWREAGVSGFASLVYAFFLYVMPSLPSRGDGIGLVERAVSVLLVAAGELGAILPLPTQMECASALTISAGLGALIMAYGAVVWIKWLVFDERRFESKAQAFGALLLLLGIATAGVIGLSRASGLAVCQEVALAPRYYMWGLMAVLGVLLHLSASFHKNRFVLLGLTVVVSIYAITSFYAKIGQVTFARARQLETEIDLVLGPPLEANWAQALFPETQRVVNGRELLMRENLATFGRLGWILSETAPIEPTVLPSCAAGLFRLSQMGRAEQVWDVWGWSTAVDAPLNGDLVLMFDSGSGDLLGAARHTRPPHSMPAELDRRGALRASLNAVTRTPFLINAMQADYGFGGTAIGEEEAVRSSLMIGYDSGQRQAVCRMVDAP